MIEQEGRGLPSDDKILMGLQDVLDDNLTVTQSWRQTEVKENFAMFEGNQWVQDTYRRQVADGLPAITINRVSPVLEAICGFEIQNRLDISYIPRLLNPEQMGFNDVVNTTARYIEQNAKAQSQYSLSFKDLLLCGVGAISTTINYDNNSDGEVEVRRVFPAFVFWDVTARAKNLIDANYVVEVKVLDQKAIEQAYGVSDTTDLVGNDIDARLLQFFETILAVKSLGVVYEYQWRTKESFYRVENPFLELGYIEPENMEALSALAEQLAIQYKFDPKLDKLFSVESVSELNELKEMFGFFNIELVSTKQKKFKYYRAISTGGRIIEKAESFSQTGFTIKFMTGQFSELTQMYYGLGRGCRDPQRMLNQTVSDYVAFLQTIPKGGVHIESDAVSDVAAFIQTYTKARSVTVFNPGALAGGKMLPKITPALPSGILEMIQYADAQIMQVCGVTPEFMGMMNSKEMNASFYRQQMKQGLAPLTTYLDAKATFLQRQAELYIDCVRVLADNCEGRLIKNVIGEKNAPYIRLLKDGIAAEYDVVVDEVPDSADVNGDIAMKLLDLQQSMPQVNLIPIVMKLINVPGEIKEQLEELVAPAPPPEPDPINQRLLTSQAEYNEAQADKLRADTMKINIDAAIQEKNLPFEEEKFTSDIELVHAKTLAELTRAGKTHTEASITRDNQHTMKQGNNNDRTQRVN